MEFLGSEIIPVFVGIFIPFFLAPILSYGSDKKMYPWYAELKRPSWTPPDLGFCVIWTFLYSTMGYASYRVWNSQEENQFALIIYGIQLVVTISWSQTFFNFHLIGWAVIHMILVLILVAILLINFWSVDLIAGCLIVPYLLWIIFATNLIYTFWKLNCKDQKKKD